MKSLCNSLVILVIFAVAGAYSCGGGGGGEGPKDVQQEQGGDIGGPDKPQPECTSDEDCKGKFSDLTDCEQYFCDVTNGVCAKKAKPDDTPCDDGDPCTSGDRCLSGVCTPTQVCECRGAEDCKDKFDDLGQCMTYFCNREVNGGQCDKRPKADGTPCDDGNYCTQEDSCKDGECLPGPINICDCLTDEDCEKFEDGDLCNGTLVCSKDFPHKCVVDPNTIVKCDASMDTTCLKNTCEPSTGQCVMKPANDGKPCDDNNVCTKSSVCQEGVCTGVEMIVCEDNNPCTDNTCDPIKGCVFVPNQGPCDDGNACTKDDYCANAKCVPGTPVVCDDGVFCNGEETCDPQKGCVPGEPPTCDDNNECTIDSCDNDLGKCVHVQADWAKEGPMGSPSCSDGEDNDCDGKKDMDDPECHYGITAISPAEGPSAGGTVVSLLGSGLDATKVVVFGDTEVNFTIKSPTEIVLTTPPHEPGLVDVSVSTGWITYTLPKAFRYTGQSSQTNLTAIFIKPASWEMSEGDTLEGVEAVVEVLGLEPGQTPDPEGLLAQVGFGLRNTLPWEDPSWTWQDLQVSKIEGDTITYVGSLKVELGGYFHMAVRVSSDGGNTFVFGDLDGSEEGYSPDHAAALTVWGKPRPGALVINELMWMGSNENPNLPSPTYDEWFEIRNMTRAPFNLSGYVVKGAAVGGEDLLLDDPRHTVYNLILEPFGYFLVADYDEPVSKIATKPDIVCNTRMSLPNQAPHFYFLVAPDGTVLDQVKFTGNVGYNGDPALGKPDKSMERNADPGDGRDDANWHTAFWHEGWDGDPFQVANFGTPGLPNSDIPLCSKDSECAQSYPQVAIGACQARVCSLPVGRCTISDVEDGSPCDDGLFCTEEDACQKGKCVGRPLDCADDDLCTLDECDEDGDQCLHLEKDCADDNLCTEDYCDGNTGECRNDPKDCEDGDLCTLDFCDPGTGECGHAEKDCEDGDLCTNNYCDPEDGTCKSSLVSCGDGDPCTLDTCDPATGCHNDPIPDCAGCQKDEDCEDGSMCTIDVCQEDHTCAWTKVLCDDNNPCTLDLCDDLSGECLFPPKVCDDGNACTIDSCDPETGECLFEQDPEAVEGPKVDPSCSDKVDNDCDGLTDEEDPQCKLSIEKVFPYEYPSGSGLPLTLQGDGFAIVKKVFFETPDDQVEFTIKDEHTIVVTLPPEPFATGDYDVAVSDGIVTAIKRDALRVIDKDLSIWANTQWPTGEIAISEGESTGMIYGQVYVPGITDAGKDPGLIQAELGYGPPGSDPFLSTEWVFVPAAFNEFCLACGNNYEYMAELVIPKAGAYIVGFRFSVDGGYHFAYGDLDGWQNGWSPDQALRVKVGLPRP